MDFVKNIKGQYSTGVEPDRGDLVQSVIIVSSFAVVSIFVVGALAGAFQSKGEVADNCLQEIDPTEYNAVLTQCDDFTPFTE